MREFVELVKLVALKEDGRVMEYSGRGMYGGRCIGVSLDDYSGYRFTSELFMEAAREYRGDENEDSLIEGIADIIAGTATDNLGRGIVLYWPSVTYEEEREEEEENS